MGGRAWLHPSWASSEACCASSWDEESTYGREEAGKSALIGVASSVPRKLEEELRDHRASARQAQVRVERVEGEDGRGHWAIAQQREVLWDGLCHGGNRSGWS